VDSAGKKTPKNRDIGSMFKSASSQTPKSKVVLEERISDKEAISANAANDCDLLYRSHAEKVIGSSAYHLFYESVWAHRRHSIFHPHQFQPAVKGGQQTAGCKNRVS
jgi:hypothetical protein